MIKEQPDSTCKTIVESLKQIEHTVGVDLFLYHSSLDDDKVFSILGELPKLREIVLFPILSPKSLINEIEKVTMSSLESLNLGIMNITIVEYRRLFGEALSSFPKLSKL